MDNDLEVQKQAFREDARRRECEKVYTRHAPNVKEKDYFNKAWIFEHGDHQPDGSVIYKDGACGAYGISSAQPGQMYAKSIGDVAIAARQAQDVHELLLREQEEKSRLCEQKMRAATAEAQAQEHITSYYNRAHNHNINDPGHCHHTHGIADKSIYS